MTDEPTQTCSREFSPDTSRPAAPRMAATARAAAAAAFSGAVTSYAAAQ